MRKIVGYLEGTDPLWLTTLQLQGRDTLPMSNGQDGHGLNVQLITQHNRPDILVCWLHKLIWPGDELMTPRELLHNTTQCNIPVLVACPKEHHEHAASVIGELADNIQLVDPGELLETALKFT